MENNTCKAITTNDVYCVKESTICESDTPLPGVQLFVLLTASCLCCVLNGLLIAATLKARTVGNGVKVLTVNLAISYIIVGVYILPFWSISVFYSKLVFPKLLCFLHPFIIVVTINEAQFSLATISVDRYLTIYYPFKYPLLLTNMRIILCIMVLLLISTALGIPPFFNWGRYCYKPRTMPICSIYWSDDLSYAIFLFSISIAIPTFVMFFCYFKISMLAKTMSKKDVLQQYTSMAVPKHSGMTRIPGYGTHTSNVSCLESSKSVGSSLFVKRQSRKTISSNNNNNVPKRNIMKSLKTLKIVLFSVGLLLLCWLPYTITNIWIYSNKEVDLHYALEFITTFLTYLNSVANPVVFLLMNRDYRRYISRLFRKMTGRNNRVTSMSWSNVGTMQNTISRNVNVRHR